MENFQLIKPSPLLTPYVKHYWFLEIDEITSSPQRVTPIGSVDLIFHRGGRMFSVYENDMQPRAFISGQSREFTDIVPTDRTDMICISFKPQGARAFFSMPMNEFYNQKIDIHLLADKELLEIEKRLNSAGTTGQCVDIIENYLFKKLSIIKEYNHKRIESVIQAVNRGEDNLKNLSDISCLSYKQFQRIFSDHVGANPKDFLRVIRFQRSLFTLQYQPDINLAQLAVENGYYDQSHLIRDFKTFSGYTPTEYMAVCDPYSDYFS